MADFVQVLNWVDTEGHTYNMDDDFGTYMISKNCIYSLYHVPFSLNCIQYSTFTSNTPKPFLNVQMKAIFINNFVIPFFAAKKLLSLQIRLKQYKIKRLPKSATYKREASKFGLNVTNTLWLTVLQKSLLFEFLKWL